jgi:glycosyltransferase involved in cell wall biosynthesis
MFEKNLSLFQIGGVFWDTAIDQYYKKLYSIISKEKIDILHCQQEVSILASLKIKEKLNVHIIADLHGSIVEEQLAMDNLQKNSKKYKKLKNLERKICQNSDKIVIISKEMQNYFKNEYNIPTDKFYLLPNPVKSKINKIETNFSSYKIVFSGMLSHRENVDLLVNSLYLIKNKFPNVEFFITGGTGEKRKYTMALTKKLNLTINYCWFKNENELFMFLKNCYIGLIPSSKDMARQMSYPAKLFDYISVGLPVIANDIGSWTKIISENRFGLVVPSTPEQFANGITTLLSNPELRYEYALNGLNYIKKLESLDKITILYNEIMKT